MSRQLQIKETQTDLSMAADDLVELRDLYLKSKQELKERKEVMDQAAVRVAGIMVTKGMSSMKHLGLTFTVKEPDTELTVQIKEE